jgi:glucose-1-phosphate adenylyltransferase
VHSYCEIDASVLLPEVEVGRNCRISHAVIDRGCRVPSGTIIGEDPVADARRFRVTEKGIVLVTAGMFGQDPTISQT